MKLIDRYILKGHIGPFFFALFTVLFLFLFQFLIKTIDQLVGKGLSMWVITQLIALNLAWMVTLAVPMAVLVATLMAFGSLSSENEITVMRASGIGLIRLMTPVVLASLVLCWLMVMFNNDVLPDANHKARTLLGDIGRTKPTLVFEAGKFTDNLEGVRILVDKIDEQNGGLTGIYIYNFSNPASRELLTAKFGTVAFSQDLGKIVLNLNEGEIHQLSLQNPSGKYRKIEFNKHRLLLSADGFGFQQSGENSFQRGDRELSAEDMTKKIDTIKLTFDKTKEGSITSLLADVSKLASLKYKDTVFTAPVGTPPDSNESKTRGLVTQRKDKAVFTDTLKLGKDTKDIINRKIAVPQAYDTLKNIMRNVRSAYGKTTNIQQIRTANEKQIDAYEVEIYKKYSIPFACLVFVLVGAPLGYKVRKGGFGIAAGLSLLFFLLYWMSLIGGEKLADRGLFSPWLGMWIANILVALFGIYLILRSK